MKRSDSSHQNIWLQVMAKDSVREVMEISARESDGRVSSVDNSILQLNQNRSNTDMILDFTVQAQFRFALKTGIQLLCYVSKTWSPPQIGSVYPSGYEMNGLLICQFVICN